MRLLSAAAALTLLISSDPARAQTVSPSACPPAESLYTDRPLAPGRDLSVRQQRARYATYVIDSTYVLANQRQVPPAGETGALGTLSPDDIDAIEILKGGAATRWNRCAGVMTISILTKSRKWRPPPVPRTLTAPGSAPSPAARRDSTNSPPPAI